MVESSSVAPKGLPALIAGALKLKPVRVFLHFASRRGPLLSSGLAYQSIFAIFAALWLAFSIAGLVIQGNPSLKASLIAAVAQALPGLIQDGSTEGAVDPNTLLKAGILGFSGAVALVGLLATALGWMASSRDAIRDIFSLPGVTSNFLLLKVKDLGVALVFGAAVIVSAVLSAASTALLGVALEITGVGSKSVVATVLARILGLIVVLAIDTLVLAALYRLLAGVSVPTRRLFAGSLIAGVAIGALKALGNTLLGGASNNPLLASFAVIIGLLIWFNLACQVLLLGAAWIAVGLNDSGIAVDPAAAAKRAEEERLIVLGREAEQRRARGLFARLFGRRSPATSHVDETAPDSSASGKANDADRESAPAGTK
ncbi:MAG: YihY/virulence factor BrkB family protein [Microbacteriaceae bacterium]|nr:YihY/virulence factor BrkB family protein [Microbacteriaceae bacterium]